MKRREEKVASNIILANLIESGKVPRAASAPKLVLKEGRGGGEGRKKIGRKGWLSYFEIKNGGREREIHSSGVTFYSLIHSLSLPSMRTHTHTHAVARLHISRKIFCLCSVESWLHETTGGTSAGATNASCWKKKFVATSSAAKRATAPPTAVQIFAATTGRQRSCCRSVVWMARARLENGFGLAARAPRYKKVVHGSGLFQTSLDWAVSNNPTRNSGRQQQQQQQVPKTIPKSTGSNQHQAATTKEEQSWQSEWNHSQQQRTGEIESPAATTKKIGEIFLLRNPFCLIFANPGQSATRLPLYKKIDFSWIFRFSSFFSKPEFWVRNHSHRFSFFLHQPETSSSFFSKPLDVLIL